MKKIVLPVLLALMMAGCKEKSTGSFTVSGSLKNSPAKIVYVEETVVATGEKKLKDSSVIAADGKYSMKIPASEEGVYNLRLQNEGYQFATIINDAPNITVNADFSNQYDFYNVSGSPSSKSIQDFLAKISEWQREKFNYYKQVDSIRKNKGDSLMADKLLDKSREIINSMKSFAYQEVEKANNAPLGFILLASYQGMARDPNYMMDVFTDEELIGLLNDMLNKFPGRADLAGIKNSIEEGLSKKGWVGKEAPEISLPDTEGKMVSLSSYRGKYVLVDFWASWCGPCRRENPNVVEAFNRFRNKNFTILGVSLDRNKEAWEKAIAADNLNWTHISDLKQWESVVVPMYKISGIPFNVLIDPQGKVVAENLRGIELEQKLAQVLN